MQSLTYEYNCQIHRSSNETPFSLTMSRHLPGLTTVVIPSTLLDDAADEISPEVLNEKKPHQAAIIQDKAFHRLTNSKPSTNGALIKKL